MILKLDSVFDIDLVASIHHLNFYTAYILMTWSFCFCSQNYCVSDSPPSNLATKRHISKLVKRLLNIVPREYLIPLRLQILKLEFGALRLKLFTRMSKEQDLKFEPLCAAKVDPFREHNNVDIQQPTFFT